LFPTRKPRETPQENHDPRPTNPPRRCSSFFGSHIASHHPIHQNDEMRIEKRPTDLTDQVVDGFDFVLGASAVFVDHGRRGSPRRGEYYERGMVEDELGGGRRWSVGVWE
jgi:hypothetical protein